MSFDGCDGGVSPVGDGSRLLAILGGEPFDRWIRRDGTAQRIYAAFRAKWPANTVECAVIRGEFYVRQDGELMRRVYTPDDFDVEGDWCAQCGRPVDSDGQAFYCCDADGCRNVLCEDCGGCLDVGGCYCPLHRGLPLFADVREDVYGHPYGVKCGGQFAYGVEIEVESVLGDGFADAVLGSGLIAGWCHDSSLDVGGVELHTDVLGLRSLPGLVRLVGLIPDCGEHAGGHVHVARSAGQTAERWYWALHGLTARQCVLLNMRHLRDNYWCELRHGVYVGKHTAVNDEHAGTIELRSFGCWCAATAGCLGRAIVWVRDMWRFFERHEVLSSVSIERYASYVADDVSACRPM